MTDETPSIQDRIERAQSQTMDVSVVDIDPLVVQLHNHTSDTIHTVVPESIHCSCEDHTYRGTICKHLITLLDADGHVGEVTAEALKDHRDDLEHQSVDLRNQIEEIEGEIDSITQVLDELDIDQYRADSVAEIAEGLKAHNEAVRAADEDDEDGDEFAEFVADMSGGDAE